MSLLPLENSNVKRFRLIAGPNGSGKSTLYLRLKVQVNTGAWLNADEVLQQLQSKGFIDYDWLGFIPTASLWFEFVQLLSAQKFADSFSLTNAIKNAKSGLFSFSFGQIEITNPLAAFLTDFFRYALINQRMSFTTETVFSHPSKLELIKSASGNGYKTYLYFIATENPLINIARIAGRVQKGGHNVPADKVRERFYKSIALAKQSLPLFSRAFIFDNSSLDQHFLAAFEFGKLVELTDKKLPTWSRQIINI
jgi:predicted ABC-type ATPase